MGFIGLMKLISFGIVTLPGDALQVNACWQNSCGRLSLKVGNDQ